MTSDPGGSPALPILRELLEPLGTGGNVTSDAHLAALAIEHGAEPCSSDPDFTRFPGLRWRNPLAWVVVGSGCPNSEARGGVGLRSDHSG